MTAVSTAPAASPSRGFWNMVNSCMKAGSLASGSTAVLMVSMPNISTAKPSRICAQSFCLSFFENRMMTTPTAASTGVKVVGFRSCTSRLSPSRLARLRIHDVAVVPMLAPMMTPTITVVAEDDWMTAVTSAPSSTPFSLLEVSFSSIFSSLPPLALLSAELIVSIPYRNSARPPTSVSTPKMSIRFSFLSPRRTLRRLSALCTGPARSAGLPQAAVRPYTLILVFECKIGSILFVKGM